MSSDIAKSYEPLKNDSSIDEYNLTKVKSCKMFSRLGRHVWRSPGNWIGPFIDGETLICVLFWRIQRPAWIGKAKPKKKWLISNGYFYDCAPSMAKIGFLYHHTYFSPMPEKKMRLVRFTELIFLLALVLLSLALNPTLAVENTGNPDVALAASAVEMGNIQEQLRVLTESQSRVTGYPGFFRAAEYIVSKFEEYGVIPYGLDEEYYEYYDVTIPMDYGASITLDDETVLKAQNLWPNGVNPSPYVSPPQGDVLVYVGEGYYSDYEKNDVRGKFVLLDFGSRWYHRIALLHGAKGVIYSAEEILRNEVLQMSYDLPVNFPRLYLNQQDGVYLKTLLSAKGEIRIHVNSSMVWENIRVPNIVGYVRGTTIPSETIVVTACYDSWSIVPALSEGATDALGIAVLLDLARFLAEHPPSRSVLLLALSGHYQSLWGAREFVDRHFDDLHSMKALASLDLATESRQLGIYSTGSTYSFQNIAGLNNRYTWLVLKFFREYLPELQKRFGSHYGEDFVDRILLTHPSYAESSPNIDFAGTYAFDSEPYTLAVFGGGFTYHTTNSLRLYQRTPFDTYERLTLDNLWSQASFIFGTLWGLMNEPSVQLQQDPARAGPQDWGYFTITIQVSEYNVLSNYWSPFDSLNHPDEWEDILVHLKVQPTTTFSVYATGGTSYPASFFQLGGIDLVMRPNENGKIVVKGMKPYESGTVDAFVVNRTNGRIEWATDLGAYQAPPSTGRSVTFTTERYERLISMFPSGSIVGLFLYNPIDFTPIQDIYLYHHVSHGPLVHQSFLASAFGDVMAFIEPGTPTEIVIPPVGISAQTASPTLAPQAMFPLAMFLNTSEQNPNGYGYVVTKGETLILTVTPLEVATDLYRMNDERVDTLIQFNTYNPTLILFHGLAKQSLDRAQAYRESGKLGLVYGEAYAAWSFEQRAYSNTRSYTFEVIDVTTFLFFLFVPFAFFLERLLLAKTGLNRTLAVLAFFVLSLATLALFHPGFSLATNVTMVLMSFTIVVLVIPLLGFIGAEAASSIKVIRIALMGVHTIDISRTGAVSQAFSVGIESMKKRKSRSILTLASIGTIVFALVTFTSITTIPVPSETYAGDSPRYQGLLVRTQPWSALPEEIYHNLRLGYESEAVVAPRGWWQVASTGRGGVGYYVFTPKRLTQIGAFLFLSAEEATVTGADIFLADGRWFVQEEVLACIMSEKMAESLTKELGVEITLKSKIPLLGLNLTVVGLVRDDWFNDLRDLDNEPLTPVMPVIDWARMNPPPHFSANEILILPYSLGLMMRDVVQLMSIGIKPTNSSRVSENAVDLARRVIWDIYAGEGDSIKIVRARSWITLIGGTYFLIPFFICSLTIFNMTLGSVYERTNHIKVYTSVGLSPTHITGMFLAESLVYAVIGSVIGYLIGIFGCNLLGAWKLYPPNFFPNFSSYFVFAVIGISSAVTVIATVYPARMAWRLVTPSLMKKWTLRGPVYDKWQVQFPFVASEKETESIFLFLMEFLKVVGAREAAAFMARDITLDVSRRELKATVQLAPFEAGIVQNMIIAGNPIAEDRFSFSLSLDRTEGFLIAWKASNRIFIDIVRKQFLVWRALPLEEKKRYMRD